MMMMMMMMTTILLQQKLKTLQKNTSSQPSTADADTKNELVLTRLAPEGASSNSVSLTTTMLILGPFLGLLQQ